MVDFEDIRSRTTNVRGYIDELTDKDKDIMLEMYNEYELDASVVDELKDYGQLTVIAFSAAWCKDCKNAMPVMLRLEEQLDWHILVFSKIKTDPLNPDVQWKVPPSPPEANDWGITAIPWFEFFDSSGEKVGTLIEKPQVKETLEAEILYVLKNK